MSDRLPLPMVARELIRLGLVQPAPRLYHRIYLAAVDARIPAEWDHGRWYVAPKDLPLIAATLFGYVPPSGQKSKHLSS